jgi:hypothetical protein
VLTTLCARGCLQDAVAAAFSGGASESKKKPPKAPKEAPAAAQVSITTALLVLDGWCR